MKKTLFFYSIFFCPVLFATTPHWEYSGKSGPTEWAKLTPEFSQCAGSNQSPIDLTNLIPAKLAPLEFHYQFGGNSIVNNGHTIQINYVPGSTLKIDGIGFELKQFHFHTPSENLIEGKSYPLEGHLVHVSPSGEIAVVAVMFEIGKSNEVLANAWKKLPTEIGKPQQLTTALSAAHLLPNNRGYYRFSGSLTTPPCSEGVRWFVMKQPVEVSQSQINLFKSVMLHPNNRPVQPLNGRVVITN
nr:carbonic anhydrase family protein [Aeromonas veronii]